MFSRSRVPICSKIINLQMCYVPTVACSAGAVCLSVAKIINLQMCYVPTVACSSGAVCLFAQQQDI